MIQWAVEDARHYLMLGCQFEVLTDHRPLEGVFLKPLSEIANARLLCIRMKTTDYPMKVTWTPGEQPVEICGDGDVPCFSIGDRVRLQNPISKKWDTLGEVVAVRVGEIICRALRQRRADFRTQSTVHEALA